jgi:hypothetical protein
MVDTLSIVPAFPLLCYRMMIMLDKIFIAFFAAMAVITIVFGWDSEGVPLRQFLLIGSGYCVAGLLYFCSEK